GLLVGRGLHQAERDVHFLPLPPIRDSALAYSTLSSEPSPLRSAWSKTLSRPPTRPASRRSTWPSRFMSSCSKLGGRGLAAIARCAAAVIAGSVVSSETTSAARNIKNASRCLRTGLFIGWGRAQL